MFRNRVYIKRLIASAIFIIGVFIAALCYQDGFENETANDVVGFSLADIALPEIKIFKFNLSEVSLPDISLGAVLDTIGAPFTREPVATEEDTENEVLDMRVEAVTDSEVDIALSSDLLDATVSLNTAEGKKRLVSKVAYYVDAYFDFFKDLIPEDERSLDKVKWYYEKLKEDY